MPKYLQHEVYTSILRPEHAPLLHSFESNSPELNDYLKTDALGYQNLHLGVTYLLFSKAGGHVISYLTVANGSLRISDSKEFVLRGRRLGDYPKDFPRQFPALLICKLATDKKEEGCGGAGLLLEYAVSIAMKNRQTAGCSHLIAHAKASAGVIDWYEHKGFRTDYSDFVGMETVPLYLELP